MSNVKGASSGAAFSHHRRTAAILIGEGTGTAYLAGALKALTSAGVRIDLLLGKGSGALVAVLGAIGADERLLGDDGLLAAAATRRPWQLRPLYKFTIACLVLSFAAFLSPVLVGLVALLILPFATIGGLLGGGAESPGPSWFAYLLDAGEPFYLRAMVVPLIVLCSGWLGWWVVSFVTSRKRPTLPELYDVTRLTALVESGLWGAVRGASSDERPPDRHALGEAYRKLLAGSFGQRGFRELIFYALDSDSGQESAFVLLKERFAKKLKGSAGGRLDRVRSEPIDLADDGAPLFFHALLAALSPPAWVPSVPIKLPLGTVHGGEVHRFTSSILASASAVSDAVDAGAEQIVFVSASARSDRPSGNPLERVTEAALRKILADELARAAGKADLPVFLIRPDKQRLSLYEVDGREQIGNERLDLSALAAHGERDAVRLFIEPLLGGAPERADEATVPVSRAGPREL